MRLLLPLIGLAFIFGPILGLTAVSPFVEMNPARRVATALAVRMNPAPLPSSTEVVLGSDAGSPSAPTRVPPRPPSPAPAPVAADPAATTTPIPTPRLAPTSAPPSATAVPLPATPTVPSAPPIATLAPTLAPLHLTLGRPANIPASADLVIDVKNEGAAVETATITAAYEIDGRTVASKSGVAWEVRPGETRSVILTGEQAPPAAPIGAMRLVMTAARTRP